MNNQTIEDLKEALRFSPDNALLRLLLADNLSASNRLEEAEGYQWVSNYLSIERSNK